MDHRDKPGGDGGIACGKDNEKTARHLCRTALGDIARRAVEGLGDKRKAISCSSVAWVVCRADELGERWWANAAIKVRLTEV